MDENRNIKAENTVQSSESAQPVESMQPHQDESHEQMPHDTGQMKPVDWLDTDWINQLRSRWTPIQVQFVDQPRAAVEQAEALVAEAVERITQMLTSQQTSLSEQLCNHEDASTEDLRITLQNYRSFLNNLLDH